MSGSARRPAARAARAAMVLALAALAVFGAAFLDAGEKAAAEPEDPGFFGGAIPAYPGAREATRLGDGLELNGMPMRVAYFVTDDPPDAVRDFYAHAFAAEGLQVQAGGSADAGGAVIAWDVRHGHQRSVSILAQDGETLVFPAVVPVRAAPSAHERPLPPAPEGSRLVSDLVASDGEDGSRTVSMVTSLGEKEAASDLVRRLEGAGFEVKGPEPTLAGRVVEARGPGGLRTTYVISGGSGRPTGVVAVTRRAR